MDRNENYGLISKKISIQTPIQKFKKNVNKFIGGLSEQQLLKKNKNITSSFLDYEGGDIKDNKNNEQNEKQSQVWQKGKLLKSKNKSFVDCLVISILFITALANSAYAIIAPFLPFEFHRKEIDQSWIGYIFSAYSIAVIIGSPLVGYLMPVIGRRNLIVTGMLIMGISFLLFGFTSYIESNKEAFIFLSLMNRFLQGMGSCFIQTTMYSISTNFYPDNKETMIGYIEAVTGIGFILGPLLGSLLYYIGGYRFIFFSVGSLFIIMSQFVKCIFGSNIDAVQNNSKEDNYFDDEKNLFQMQKYSSQQNNSFQKVQSFDYQQEAQNYNIQKDDSFFYVQQSPIKLQKTRTQFESQSPDNFNDQKSNIQTSQKSIKNMNQKQKINITAFKLLSKPRYLFAALSGSLGYFLYGFIEPILAFRMKDFQLTQVQIGLFFMVMPIFYIPTSLIVQKIPNGIQKRAIIITALLFSFIGNLFTGPSQMFGFPDSIWIMIVGQAFHGLVDPYILVPSLPEMIESVLDYYPGQETEVNDISSGIFNMFLGIGQVSGPVFGSIITDLYGFRICCDLVAIISLLYALIYFAMAEGANSYITSKFINVQEEDQLEILNRSVLPMADIKTPIANPSIIRSHSKIMRESGSFIHRMNSSRFIQRQDSNLSHLDIIIKNSIIMKQKSIIEWNESYLNNDKEDHYVNQNYMEARELISQTSLKKNNTIRQQSYYLDLQEKLESAQVQL